MFIIFFYKRQTGGIVNYSRGVNLVSFFAVKNIQICHLMSLFQFYRHFGYEMAVLILRKRWFLSLFNKNTQNNNSALYTQP